MERHEWLTQELMSLSWYAHYLKEALQDPDLPDAGKTPCAAAAKYLLEWDDIIPVDEEPVFGSVDDLFVIYYGLQQLMQYGGRPGKAYGERMLPSNASLGERVSEARSLFGGFWRFMVEQVKPGFQHIARVLKKEPGKKGELAAQLQSYIDTQSQKPVPPIEADALSAFLRRYTARG